MSNEGWDNLADYFGSGPYAHFVTEKSEAGLPCSLVRLRQPAGDLSDPPMPFMSLITVGSIDDPVEMKIAGASWSGKPRVGAHVIVPPNMAFNVFVGGEHEIDVLEIPAGILNDFLEDARLGPHALDPLLAVPVENDLVNMLRRSLWQQKHDGAALGELYAEATLRMIVASLLAHSVSSSGMTLKRRKGGLTQRQLRLVTDFVDAHLQSPFALADLARLVRLSTTYFARAFKVETGTTPWRFVLERRIQRARSLLATSDRSVEDIAIYCGFGGASQLRRAFRKMDGRTIRDVRGVL